MAGQDALAGQPSAAGGGSGETVYSPTQWVSDIWNLGQAEQQADIFMARGQPKYGYQQEPGYNISGFQYGGANKYTGRIAPTGGTQDDVKSLRDAVNWIQTLEPGHMQQFTTALYAAGYYPDSDYGKNPNQPVGGGKVFDEHAQYGARALFDDVVKYNVANPTNQKSMMEILQDRINNKVGQTKIESSTQATPGKAYDITVDDPATLRAQVVRTGQAILGRALNDKETDALVQKMTQAEVTPQKAMIQAGQDAETGGDVILQQARVDAQARMAESMKAQNPDEAGAYSELNYSSMLMNMLGGGQAPSQAGQ